MMMMMMVLLVLLLHVQVPLLSLQTQLFNILTVILHHVAVEVLPAFIHFH